MKRRIGCVTFTLIGLAWLGYFFIEWFALTQSDCGNDQACVSYSSYVQGFIFWRGLSIALLIIMAYLIVRRFTKGDDVQ